MNVKKYYLLIGIVFLMGLLPQQNVSADMGPKPTMTFEFVQEVPGQALTMVSWSLINCKYNDCREGGGDLPNVIPLDIGFDCAENKCDASMLYLASHDYFQMEIVFSDGVTRKSNVFTSSYFDARYRVKIETDSLVVNELKGNNANRFVILFAIFGVFLVLPGAIGIILIGIVVALVYTAHKSEGVGELVKRIKSILFRVTVVTFFISGLLLSFDTFLFTLFIECLLAFVLLRVLKYQVNQILYAIFIANVYTQPIFVLLQTDLIEFVRIYTITSIMILELIVWLAETVIVNKLQGKQLPLKNIFILTFILNAVSFGIGLLLPI